MTSAHRPASVGGMPGWTVAASAGIVILTLALDLALPASVNTDMLYVAAVLVGLWAPGTRLTLAVAIACTILLTASAARSVDVLSPLEAGLDHLFAMVGVWSAAVVTWWHGQLETSLTTSAKELADYKHALDQASIVAITDRRGIIQYVNDKFCEISRYPREELLGQDHRMLNSGTHPHEFMRELWATIGRGRAWRGEICNRAKDGSLYWVDTTIIPFLGADGKPVQHVAIRTDITERKRAEERLREQAALARLGEMAAVVAHEVKNPLAGIAGALGILRGRMAAHAPERPVIDEMLGRLAALDGMVQDLLLFARPKAPQLQRVALRSLVDEALALHRSDPALADVEVTVTGEDVELDADADMLRQVLTNLVLNAAQAMSGRGRIDVAIARDGPGVVLRVTDQGPGIAPDARDRVFEPFFTTKSRGTGLGLPLARRHVEAHGGSLVVEPVEGSGACLAMRLPLRPAQ